METTKMSLEYQLKAEKDKIAKKDKEVEKIKTERLKFETKVQAVEAELNVRRNKKVRQPELKFKFSNLFLAC